MADIRRVYRKHPEPGWYFTYDLEIGGARVCTPRGKAFRTEEECRAAIASLRSAYRIRERPFPIFDYDFEEIKAYADGLPGPEDHLEYLYFVLEEFEFEVQYQRNYEWVGLSKDERRKKNSILNSFRQELKREIHGIHSYRDYLAYPDDSEEQAGGSDLPAALTYIIEVGKRIYGADGVRPTKHSIARQASNRFGISGKVGNCDNCAGCKQIDRLIKRYDPSWTFKANILPLILV